MPNIMWRRLDAPGMEACSISHEDGAPVISGMAIYASRAAPVCVSYSVACNSDWECRSARVERWVGADKLDLRLKRHEDGRWTLNDQMIGGVDAIPDIDLGFTPATNTIAIRRLRLAVGESRELTAVWLDEESWTFRPLRQRYERLSENTYRYVSVESGYEADLTVDSSGLVQVYSDLWEAVLT